MAQLSLALEQQELETRLFEAANILRGPVDAADFKTYIFPLLFFKRISDVYDEEYRRALNDSGGDLDYASFNEHHRFKIPEGCRWGTVQETSIDVGKALQDAFQCIETANQQTLSGIFGDASWTNKERLSDELLRDLVNHFSGIPLSNAAVSGDILGQAYEYLIKKFADATNKKAGEFYTPRSIVRLLIDILDPKEGETIYDPACGTGGMLLEAVQHVRTSGGNPRTLLGRLYGQEKNLTTSSIARMNLLLHDVEDFHIARGDTLRHPVFFTDGKLTTFDCVIANPPFSLERWGEENWEHDHYGRNVAGVPPRDNGDYAWVQHMLSSMQPQSGRMAVVLPHGVLFRMGAEGRIRQRLIEDDLLDAVIGLGSNLFYGTGLAACILVFRKQKPAKNRQRVLVIDGSRLYKRGRKQNTLEPDHASQILNWYLTYKDVPGAVRAVPLSEIAGNNWNLNITRYIEPVVAEQSMSVEEALINLQVAVDDAQAAEERLRVLLRNNGLAD